MPPPRGSPPPSDYQPPPPPDLDDEGDPASDPDLAAQVRAHNVQLALARLERERQRRAAEALRQEQARRVEAEGAELRELVAAILCGGARLASIDPNILRSPKALTALEIARKVRDVLIQHELDACAEDALIFLRETMNNPGANPKDRVAAAQTILGARAKMTGPKAGDPHQRLRAALTQGDTKLVIGELTDAALQARLRDALASTGAPDDGDV